MAGLDSLNCVGPESCMLGGRAFQSWPFDLHAYAPDSVFVGFENEGRFGAHALKTIACYGYAAALVLSPVFPNKTANLRSLLARRRVLMTNDIRAGPVLFVLRVSRLGLLRGPDTKRRLV